MFVLLRLLSGIVRRRRVEVGGTGNENHLYARYPHLLEPKWKMRQVVIVPMIILLVENWRT